ncbi:MAG: 4Fe-4S binding protein [Bacteroidales bacterium]|nr:4Fe-4S binding protein [Bacteroidales bacterium]
MNKILLKYQIAIFTFISFLIIGLIVWYIRDIRYFFLFAGIGTADAFSRVLVEHYPKLRQVFRRILMIFIGCFLFIGLSLIIGVNFQFPQIVFDTVYGIVTGALIQLIIARIILPFFLGNAFCSRACWDGAIFEFVNSSIKCNNKPKPRSNILAWGYLVFLVGLAIYVSLYWNVAQDINLRKKWIIGENIFIIAAGITLTKIWGSRAYCRRLCPFLTISGVISPISLFKITPVDADKCTACNLCNNACPMLIDVKEYVKQNKRINNPTCILCERCVSACPNNVISLSLKNHKL